MNTNANQKKVARAVIAAMKTVCPVIANFTPSMNVCAVTF